MKSLKLSKDIEFPSDMVTASGVIYGGKGMGKSSLGISVSPRNSTASASGSRRSTRWASATASSTARTARPRAFEVLIIGGKHGDIEIEPTSGAVVADLVVDEHVSTVIDISRHKNGKMWSKAEKIRFVADYCTRLYERQGEKMEPLLLIIDEAGLLPAVDPQRLPRRRALRRRDRAVSRGGAQCGHWLPPDHAALGPHEQVGVRTRR